MNNVISAEPIVTQLVSAGLSKEQVLVSGPAFEQVTTLWNKDVPYRPAVVVRCQTASDVQTAVRVAAAASLPLSVRGGGHHPAGLALRDGGLVIDLSRMRGVEVTGDVAVVQGGATNLDVVTAAEAAGQVAVAGNVGSVGFTGLATGGGYGPFAGRLGLAADHILGADVVLADGRLVTADAGHEPELFWAIRGGGGNFGVITSLRVRLHPKTPFRTGRIVFPLEQAREVLRGYAELLKDAPDGLIADAGMLTVPGGPPVVFIAPAWTGEPAEGDEILGRIAGFGTPLMNTVADASQSAILRENDKSLSAGGKLAISTRSLAELTPGAIDTLIDIALKRPSTLPYIYWHHSHGAAARVPVTDTAFGERRDHLMLQLIAQWPGGEDGSAGRAWLHAADASIAPHALPGGYPNLLAPDSHEQIAQAYGPNAARLRAAKAHYDPSGVFSAIPLPE